MTTKSFIRGTMILIIAGMITRVLGFINRIIVARVMGEEGVGLYMMALPTLFLLITLTQIGLPIAISKRVAEADATKDRKKIKQIISISLLIITCTSILFTIVIILFAPIIADHLLTDSRTLYPIYAIAPIVPVIALTSVIKGYFQGVQNMKPQSAAIIIEQTIRIIAVFLLVSYLVPYGIEFAATGAMVSVLIGEAASLLYLIYLFKRKKVVKVRQRFFANLKGSKQTGKDLFSIAIPNTGSKLISAITNFLEPIIVAQSLTYAGVTVENATKQYGELTGFAMPLLFLPSFITNSLSIALVPAISEAEAKDSMEHVHYRITQAVRISFASGALATIIFSLFSIPILTYMYDSSNASRYIILMAPFFLLLYIQAPLQAALFALDYAKQAMWNSFIGAIFKFAVLIFLASNATYGIMGVAIAISASVVLITLLHLHALNKAIQFKITIKDTLKMCTLLLVTYISGYVLKILFGDAVNEIGYLLIIFFILSIIYLINLFLLKFITKAELKQIPYIQQLFNN